MLRSMGKLDFIDVPYKGMPQAITDVHRRLARFTFADLANALAQIKGGKLRGLAVTSQKRSPLAPDVPAIAEELPGYELIAWFALMAPAKTPADVVQKPARRRGQEPRQARREGELRDLGTDVGADEPRASSAKFIRCRDRASGRSWSRLAESSLNRWRAASRGPRPRPHHRGDGPVRDPDPRRLRRRRDQGRAARRRRDPPGLAVPQPRHGRPSSSTSTATSARWRST